MDEAKPIKIPKKIGIAGAGLAGLLSALWIKEKNPEVEIEIFERRKKDKYRIDCAEALLDQRKAFDRVGELVKPFITNKLDKVVWKMELDGEYKLSTIRYSQPPCWMVDRLSWQRDLMEKVERHGVSITFGERVDPIRILDDFDLVVDARGTQSREYFASGVYSVFSGNFEKIADTTISEIREDSNVYYWIFPINAKLANIGCGTYFDFIKRRVLEEYISELEFNLDEEIKRGAGLVDISYGAMLHHGEEKVIAEQVDGKGIVRVGDAAGLADPLSGEGMTGAISSAFWLAYSISRGDHLDNPDYLAEYERKVRVENEFLSQTMAAMEARREHYRDFVKFMSLLDGVNGKYLTSKLFVLRYPIRALKLRFM
ncbi:MAG: NAD(P)/FAD-dependent oxidoreductase [Archaeoglobus sp.]|nr:NAD(P)/FAD-dependent oxidoreductase [Archaeoglobus sp.]